MNKKMLSAIMALAVAAGNFQTAAAAVTASAANVQTKDENTDASKNAAGTVNAVQVKASGSKTNEDPSASTQTTTSSDTTTTTTTTTTTAPVSKVAQVQFQVNYDKKTAGTKDADFNSKEYKNNCLHFYYNTLSEEEIDEVREILLDNLYIYRENASDITSDNFDPYEIQKDPVTGKTEWKYKGEIPGLYHFYVKDTLSGKTIYGNERYEISLDNGIKVEFSVNTDNYQIQDKSGKGVDQKAFNEATDIRYESGSMVSSIISYARGNAYVKDNVVITLRAETNSWDNVDEVTFFLLNGENKGELKDAGKVIASKTVNSEGGYDNKKKYSAEFTLSAEQYETIKYDLYKTAAADHATPNGSEPVIGRFNGSGIPVIIDKKGPTVNVKSDQKSATVELSEKINNEGKEYDGIGIDEKSLKISIKLVDADNESKSVQTEKLSINDLGDLSRTPTGEKKNGVYTTYNFIVSHEKWLNQPVSETDTRSLLNSLQQELGNTKNYKMYLCIEGQDKYGNPCCYDENRTDVKVGPDGDIEFPIINPDTGGVVFDNTKPSLDTGSAKLYYEVYTPEVKDDEGNVTTAAKHDWKYTNTVYSFDDNYDYIDKDNALYFDTSPYTFDSKSETQVKIYFTANAKRAYICPADNVTEGAGTFLDYDDLGDEKKKFCIKLKKDQNLANVKILLCTDNPSESRTKVFTIGELFKGQYKNPKNIDLGITQPADPLDINGFYTDSTAPEVEASVTDEQEFNIEKLKNNDAYIDFRITEEGTGVDEDTVELSITDADSTEEDPKTLYDQKVLYYDFMEVNGYNCIRVYLGSLKTEDNALIKNGHYNIKFKISDKAGLASKEASASFKIDYIAPTIKTSVIDPVENREHNVNTGEDTDKKVWYRWEELFGGIDDEMTKVSLTSNEDLLSVSSVIEGFNENGDRVGNAEAYETKIGDSGRTALIDLSAGAINKNEAQRYEYTVTACDNSKNPSEAKYTFYADRYAPVINSIEASAGDALSGPILTRVTKFGVFSKDTVKLVINATDENDSGVADVEVEYTGADGKTVKQSLEKENNDPSSDNYVLTLKQGEFSKSDLIFRVYDNSGRVTEYKAEKSADGTGYVFQQAQYTWLNKDGNVERTSVDTPSVFNSDQIQTVNIKQSTAVDEQNYLTIIEQEKPTGSIVFSGFPEKEPSWESKGNGTTWYKKYPEMTIEFGDHAGTNTDTGVSLDSGLDNFKVYLSINGGKEEDITQTVIDRSSIFEYRSDFDNRLDTNERIGSIDNKKHVIKVDMEKVMDGKDQVDGKYSVRIELSDNAGNVNNEINSFFEIDQTSPQISEISLQEVVNNLKDKNGIQRTPYGFLFINPTIAVVKVNDVWGTNAGGTSGLNKIGYCLVEFNESNMPVNADAWDSQKNQINEEFIRNNYQTAEINGDTAMVAIPGGFRGQICAFPIDNVLNEGMLKTPDSIAIDTPEKHREDNGGVHIDVSYPSTNLKEGSNDLFPTAVSYRVRMIDNISGIRSVKCDVKSEKGLYSGYQDSFEISYEVPPTVGSQIGNGWTVAKMDNNLVTEIYKDYNFSQDDNGIEISYEMRDWAGNEPDKRGFKFTVDQTAPIINVSFQPSGSQYYKTERTATVTVTERNFNAQLIGTVIANTLPGGNVPAIGGWKDISKTEHQATITFKEGDYTFDINGKDMAGHSAIVNGLAATDKSFSIDMTDPVITDNNIFKGLSNGNDNSFQEPQTISFTVKEHNFDPDSVVVKVYGGEPGTDHTTGTLTDVTSKVISGGLKWTDSGDSHTATITVSDDGVYRIEISGKDKSGRDIKKQESPVFEIDKVAPVLDKSSPDNKSTIIYDKTSKAEKPDNIVFSDDNIDRVEYTVTAYTLKKDKDGVLNVEPETKKYSVNVADAKKAKNYSDGKIGISISDDEFKTDGIYEIKSKAYDVAGNVSDEAVHTFVVQKKSDFLVYIPGSNEETGEGLYKFDRKGIQAEKFDEIEMIAFIPQDKEFGLLIGGTEVSDDYISEVDEKDAPVINGIKRLHIKLDPSYFSTVYNDDSLDVDLALNAVAKKGSSSQEITIGHIYIDNVKPTGSFDSELLDMGFFGGYYGRKSMKIKINGVSPDIDIEQCTIELNGKAISPKKLQYNEDENAIYFTLPEGFNEIRATLVDKAGNSNPLPIVKNVYVGNFVKRFWYLFLGGGLIVAGIPTFLILKKRRENN